MNIAVSGATGFIGKKLLAELALSQAQCFALVRDAEAASALPAVPVVWTSDRPITAEALKQLSQAQAWVHLAGAPVAGHRWDEATKKEIFDSRVHGTRNLVEAIRKLAPEARPRVLIAGSAIGIYGNRGDEELTEASSVGAGFLADVVKAWEAEALKAEELGVRVVRLRTGVVLGVGGGALEQMQPVILGSGKQWMSWIHLDDVVAFIRYAIDNKSVSGAYNLTAPSPATNAEFTRDFARATGAGGLVLKAPGAAIKLALGEMSGVVLDSARVLPKRALEAVFQFKHTDLSRALLEIYPAPLDRRISAAQFVARPLEEVFGFFSEVKNLETITPPWLNFHVLKTSTDRIEGGTLIDYRLKIHGVSVGWKTRIESWVPQKQFVDVQLKGPYQKWHHTHRFEKVPGGTLVFDEVIYRLPAGKVGSLVAGAFVKKDVDKIFSFRRKKIAEVFA